MTAVFLNNSFEKACLLLSHGELVVLPTETVYGLAADALNSTAVRKIYSLKQRPPSNPLILHCATYEQAQHWAIFSTEAQKLAEMFWHSSPSPLTLVLKQTPHALTCLSPLVTAGLETVAVRIPHHVVALELLRQYKKPLAAPSANRSMRISATTSSNVQRNFGEQTPYILEGGACLVGLESTILDLSQAEPILLRPGSTTPKMLEAVLGKPVQAYQGTHLKAPGMMKRHYAPHLPLRLNCLTPYPDEAFLGFGLPPSSYQPTLNLSLEGNLEEAACHLFSMLAQLDDPTLYKGIAVMPIPYQGPYQGIGLAINDRLARGATQLGAK